MSSWTLWLQNTANVAKAIELGIFIFTGYQFWKGRRERKQADQEAMRRARIDSIYQAWQVINSAQGKGGSGGRIEALRDLLLYEVSLAGINLDGAWLEDVQLPNATLVRSSFRGANLSRANLQGANLEGADLSDANLLGADLTGARLKQANLSRARLSTATLDGADLREVSGWREIGSMSYASVEGIVNAPEGFADFAVDHGSVDRKTPLFDDDDGASYSRQFRAV